MLLQYTNTSRHDLFIHLWKDRTNPGGLLENPLVSFGKEVKFEDSQAMKYHWEFKVEPLTVMEYIGPSASLAATVHARRTKRRI